MHSYSAAVRPRRVPQQERGARRVAGLLSAAESVIAEHGYEAATMSEIADRAGASIGSLYQFFPSKRAVVQALRARYTEEFAERWLPIERDLGSIAIDRFATRLLEISVLFIDEHPAFAALLDAPRSTRIPGSLGDRIAGFVRLKRPGMPPKSAQRIARVSVHLVKAFARAWVETASIERSALKREFRIVLVCYLSSRLEGHDDSRRGDKKESR